MSPEGMLEHRGRSATRASAASRLGSTQLPSIARSLAEIRAEAAKQRDAFGNESLARSLEWAAQQVESALREHADGLLSLDEAATRSGYSKDHLARMVRQGKIPDLRAYGARGRILIRASDLPVKPHHRHIPHADVHGLARRLRGGREGRYGHL